MKQQFTAQYRFARIGYRGSLLLAGVLVGLLLSPALAAQTQDPWQGLNRQVYGLNTFFDRLVIRPVAVFYTRYTPQLAQQGIGNFFSNVNDVNVLINDLLQLKLNAAMCDSGRLVINSTVGLGGFIDVASDLGLQKNQEDFGQTLGAWGVGTGPYVMLPVFGASNARDSVGVFVDTVLNPIQFLEDSSLRWSLFAARQVDSRASLLALDDMVFGDPYLFIREAYIQRREFLVTDGEVNDGFGDF
jgi:phospholipid-binding lipoprotein MlaA